MFVAIEVASLALSSGSFSYLKLEIFKAPNGKTRIE